MDFSTEFVAFRDRLLGAQDKAFTVSLNAQVAGRAVAAFSYFNMESDRKLLGLVPTGGKGHAHEYRLLAGVPALDEAGLEDWWQYAAAAERALVRLDDNHEFSIVSLILAAGGLERAVPRRLRRLAGGRDLSGRGQGWSTIRMAVVDLGRHKIHTNRMGDPLKNILKPVL